MPGRRFWLSRTMIFALLLLPILMVGYQIPAFGLLVDIGRMSSPKIVQSTGEIPLINIYMNDEIATTSPQKEEISEEIKSTKTNSRGVTGKLISQEELELLARVIYAEARGEGIEGQVAVGAVVLNRLKDPEFPKTIKEVIFQRGAFTAVDDQQIHLLPNEVAFQAAQKALEGKDPTGGALYYYNPQTAKDQWIKSRPVVKRIGNHTFSI